MTYKLEEFLNWLELQSQKRENWINFPSLPTCYYEKNPSGKHHNTIVLNAEKLKESNN
jgi:hypothetical protein